MTIAAAEAAPAIAGEATGAAAGAGESAGATRGKQFSKGAPGAVRTNRGEAIMNERKRRYDIVDEKSRRQKIAEKIPRKKIERTNYQPIILMEFVACILLTAITPIATKKDEQGLSPYAGKDIVKLSAITVLYLILAMISVGGRTAGRYAAWFGGLILLADGLYEAGNIVKDLRLVSGAGTAKPAQSPAPGSGSGPVAPGGPLPEPGAPQPTVPLGETLPNG